MNSRTEFLSDEIHRRYGSIHRARGSFLYTAKNVRLTDLYQENGRAILGWGGSSAFTIMKNVLNRGISGSYRTDFSHRLEKSVCDLFGSNKKILCFTAKKDAEEAAGRLCDGKILSYRPWESALAYISGDQIIHKFTYLSEKKLLSLCTNTEKHGTAGSF